MAIPTATRRRIALALENKWDEIDKGGDHLAAVDTQELKSVRLEAPGKPVARSNRVAQSEAASPQIKRRFAPAMGLTKVVYFPKAKPEKYDGAPRSHRVTAGDLMRRAFGR